VATVVVSATGTGGSARTADEAARAHDPDQLVERSGPVRDQVEDVAGHPGGEGAGGEREHRGVGLRQRERRRAGLRRQHRHHRP
jgi:hypothetical protein